MSGRHMIQANLSDPEALRVRLLGPPRVESDGAVLAITRRQVRALFYYLVAQPEPVSRERLSFLFWPDAPESKARRRLSRLLAQLHRELPDRDLLLASQDCVGFDPDRVCSDLASFIRLSDPDRGAESLCRAAELYRGPFLAGFSLAGSCEFDNWVCQQQLVYERLYLNVLAALIEESTARQDYEAAIAYACRYLVTDELAEDVHRRLIVLYTMTGKRSAALRQFERCIAVLEREFGVRPLPETRAVYESALGGPQPPTTPTARDLPRANLPDLDVPLVGRDAAWADLSAALSHAQVGRGRMVLISGEPGIGKSRLMEEFAIRAGEWALVLAAAARPGEQSFPYQLIVEAVRSLHCWDRLIATAQPVWLAEAARLLPELRALYPGLSPPPPTEPEEARARLLEALCRMMLGLGGGSRPLLLCLDDLHWADSSTLDWLVWLGRQIADRSILILGTYRTTEQEAVEDLRLNLIRTGALSELRLAGLGPSSVLQIVQHVTGLRPGAPAFSLRLHRTTGGNPFFLLEILRVLLEAGGLPLDLTALDQFPLPGTVRQAVEVRLRHLSPRTRQVLEAGAVLGFSFDFDLVRRTAGREETETIDALDEAVARQILIEDPSGYRFQHAVTRQTLEATVGAVRRHLLHRQAARALEHIDPPPTARIARHYDLGGEGKKALHYYHIVARQAEDLFAWQQTEEIQSRMLELLDQLDPGHAQPEHLARRSQILAGKPTSTISREG